MLALLAAPASAFFPFWEPARPYNYGDYYVLGYSGGMTGRVVFTPSPAFAPTRPPAPPQMSDIFNPPLPDAEGESFCQSYHTDDAFPIAAYYGKNISVKYTINRDSGNNPRWGYASRHLSGRVTVYAKASCTGDPLDQRDFTMKGAWYDPYSLDGYNARWWSPEVEKLTFSLVIKGVGKFSVDERNGRWSWDGIAHTRSTTRVMGRI